MPCPAPPRPAPSSSQYAVSRQNSPQRGDKTKGGQTQAKKERVDALCTRPNCGDCGPTVVPRDGSLDSIDIWIVTVHRVSNAEFPFHAVRYLGTGLQEETRPMSM